MRKTYEDLIDLAMDVSVSHPFIYNCTITNTNAVGQANDWDSSTNTGTGYLQGKMSAIYYSFNGNAYITAVPDNPLLSTNNTICIRCLVYFNQPSSGTLASNNAIQTLVSCGTGTNTGIQLRLVGDKLEFILGTQQSTDKTTATFEPKKWYYIFACYDGSYQKIYVNRTEVLSVQRTLSTFANTETNWYVGSNRSATNTFNGLCQTVAAGRLVPTKWYLNRVFNMAAIVIPCFDYNEVVSGSGLDNGGEGLQDHGPMSLDPIGNNFVESCVQTGSPVYASCLRFATSSQTSGFPYVDFALHRAEVLRTCKEDITIGFWVKIEADNGNEQIIFSNSCNDTVSGKYSGFKVYVKPTTRKIAFWMATSATAGTEVEGPTLTLNEWTNIFITWNHSQMKFYKNGVLSTTVSLTTDPYFFRSTSSADYKNDFYYTYRYRVILGRLSYTCSSSTATAAQAKPLVGCLCDFRYYNCIVPEYEITIILERKIRMDTNATLWGYRFIQGSSKFIVEKGNGVVRYLEYQAEEEPHTYKIYNDGTIGCFTNEYY